MKLAPATARDTAHCLMLMILFCGALWAAPVSAQNEDRQPLAHPLAPPDTRSPRHTLDYFINRMNQGFAEFETHGNNERARHIFLNAIRCLDLSQVPPDFLKETAIERTLLLKEVLDRLELPPVASIPDAAAMQAAGLDYWTVPYSSIRIARVEKGEHQGEWLFSPGTIAGIKDDYHRIRQLPYRSTATEGIYETYIYSPSPVVPRSWVKALPSWLKAPLGEQTVWQWFAYWLSLIGIVFVAVAMTRWAWKAEESAESRSLRRRLRHVLVPVVWMILSALWLRFLDNIINITGSVLVMTKSSLRLLDVVATVWALVAIDSYMVELVLNSVRVKREGIDASLIRLGVHVLTACLIFAVVLWGANRFGVNLTAMITSAGIVGVAIALAARETLANFFGGLSIILDRTFRVGEYIVLDSGERGEVREVGIRSTRLMTRDDVLIVIPNAAIANAKIVNQSAPEPHFRVAVKVAVAYGSDVVEVESILREVARDNPMVEHQPEARVRLRNFGESAIEFELLCWAHRPDEKGRLVHTLLRQIYTSFKAKGIVIPFPQRDVHLLGGRAEAAEFSGQEEGAPASAPESTD